MIFGKFCVCGVNIYFSFLRILGLVVIVLFFYLVGIDVECNECFLVLFVKKV